MNPKTATRIVFSALLILLLLGCKDSALQFSVQFETLGDLKAKAAVYQDETRIGQVEEIRSADSGDFLVQVRIAPEHKSRAVQNARIYIGRNPHDAGSAALIVVPKAEGGAPIEDGAIVKGEKAPGLLDSLISTLRQNADEAAATLQNAVEEFKLSAAAKSNELGRKLENSLADLSRQFDEFDLGNRLAPSDEEIRRLEAALDDFIDEFERAGKDLQDQLRTRVIPQLRRDLEALKKRLERDRREEELKEIEGRLNELTRV